MTAAPQPTGTELLARLDRLPVGRPHRRLMLQGGLGYLFESYDAVLLGYAASAVVALWSVGSGLAGWLLASVFIGYLIGALVAGVLADRIGRRRVLMCALLVYVVFTVVAATASSPGELILWRVLSGIGVGAEATMIVPYISEFLPTRNRGRNIGNTMLFLGFGYVLAGLTAVTVISPNPEPGWRIACLVCVAPVLLLLWWRRDLVESPRFLISHGRVGEATAIVERFERETAVNGQLPPVPAVSAPVGEPAPRRNVLRQFTALWGPGLAVRTGVVCVLWFAIQAAHYGYGTWLPTLLVLKGFTITKSFSFALASAVAQIPGYYLAAAISERIDRKWTIVAFLGGSIACAAGLATAEHELAIFCFVVALSFFMNGVAGPLYAYTSEIYPTEFRATGMGLASACARVGAIMAPVGIGYLHDDLGFAGVFAVLCGLLLVGALVLALLGLRTAGRSLEALHAGPAAARTRDDQPA
ncbi:MFS transporter [Saccharopolyspora sp. NPDC000359]|uniref:MFS transporter n=1 Tax=Saccharopolyspora sp. NPDC000359 TaxID=3154251 RepID=UPI003331528A